MAISIPDTFTASNSEKYILSIRLRSDGLSFSAYNPLETGSFFYRETEFERTRPFMDNLKDFFFENELLGYSFRQIHLLCEATPYTLVPKEAYDGGQAKAFLNFNFSSAPTHALSNLLKEQDVEVVFGVEEELYEFCCRSLLNPHFVHHITPLLAYWRKTSLTASAKQLSADIHGKQLDIVCFEQGKLIFANTFRFEHLNDILYYILYVWKQLEMDQQNDQLRIAGKPEIRMRITEVLRNYIRYVSIAEAPSEVYLWGTEAVQAPLDLLTLLICE